MEIRPVRPQEHAEAGRVTVDAYREFVPEDPGPGWLRYLGRLDDVAGRAGRTLVLVAVEDGQILGTATVELESRIEPEEEEPLAPGEAHLRMLAVDPPARGRGVGRALVEASLDAARRAGKELVTLRTTGFMDVARGMYERMGFHRDPTLDYLVDDGDLLIGYRLSLAPRSCRPDR